MEVGCNQDYHGALECCQEVDKDVVTILMNQESPESLNDIIKETYQLT